MLIENRNFYVKKLKFDEIFAKNWLYAIFKAINSTILREKNQTLR